MSACPAGWVSVPVQELLGRPSTIDPGKSPTSRFELWSVPSFSDRHPETPFGREIRSSKQVVKEDDVLLCKIVPHINRVWTVAKAKGLPQIASGEWIVLRGHGCDPTYLRYCLSSPAFRAEFLQTVSGVGGSLMRARPSAVAEIAVPVAPYAEQRRIAAKLDALTARTARARADLDRIPTLAARYKQAVLARAFSGELTANWRTARGTRWPERPTSLSSVCAPGSPICYGVVQPGAGKTGGIPLIRVCDLEAQAVDWASLRTIDPAIDEEYSRSRVIDGDVLVTVVGTIGRVAVVDGAPKTANIARAVARVRPDRTMTSGSFVSLALQAPDVQRNLVTESREVARKTLNLEQLREISIAFPPKAEQDEIVRLVSTALRDIDRLAAEAAAGCRLMDRLDQEVLAKAFRGELLPQDPADEPASVLLDRIRAERAAAPKAGRGRKAAA